MRLKRVEYSERFEAVWEMRWNGSGKAYASECFERLDEEDKCLVEEAMVSHRRELASRPLERRPHLSTWINQRRFEDELGDPCAAEHNVHSQVERGFADNYGWAPN